MPLRKEPITEIGKTVPQNLKFAIIVSIAIFWAEFLKGVLILTLAAWHLPIEGIEGILGSFILAVIATIIGLFILVSYRRLKHRLAKIKIKI